jgi:hypothetical protein
MIETGPDLHGFGWVFSMNLHGLGILGHFENAERGGHGWAEWR